MSEAAPELLLQVSQYTSEVHGCDAIIWLSYEGKGDIGNVGLMMMDIGSQPR